jgi:hypothetical protein
LLVSVPRETVPNERQSVAQRFHVEQVDMVLPRIALRSEIRIEHWPMMRLVAESGDGLMHSESDR